MDLADFNEQLKDTDLTETNTGSDTISQFSLDSHQKASSDFTSKEVLVPVKENAVSSVFGGKAADMDDEIGDDEFLQTWGARFYFQIMNHASFKQSTNDVHPSSSSAAIRYCPIFLVFINKY